MKKKLPSIPPKRYFTISEVGELCGVKPHVLRYWEQEFTQLRPMKRRGNRRYYQYHEVLMIRRIRELLYDQGFTISGARNKLQEFVDTESNDIVCQGGHQAIDVAKLDKNLDEPVLFDGIYQPSQIEWTVGLIDRESPFLLHELRCELVKIRELLSAQV